MRALRRVYYTRILDGEVRHKELPDTQEGVLHKDTRW